MLQNLKVDIIYHLTNSDFEMEFNMCGCCRMRLLSDKTADRKSLIAALSRAVSRSRIIIACGPLFSAEGLIATVATAIGSKTVAVDNAAYGINGDEVINIIAGSTPLVTAEGYFGGCIIESGPQTIILLTENRAFRKSIMQTLIHPYIEEMSMIPVKEKSAPAPEPQAVEEKAEETEAPEPTAEGNFEPASVEIIEETLPDQEEIYDEAEEVIEQQTEDTAEAQTEEPEEVEVPEEDAEAESDTAEVVEEEEPQAEDSEEEAEPAEETETEDTESKPEGIPQERVTAEYIIDSPSEEKAEEKEIPFVFDDEKENSQIKDLSDKMADAYGTMYIEPERPKHSHTDKYAASYTPTEENDSFLSDSDYSLVGGRTRREKSINIPIIILTVILLIIVGLLGYFLIVVPKMQGISTVEYLRDVLGTVDNTVYL